MLTAVSFFAAFAASVLLGFAVQRWLRARQVLDVPTSRSSHLKPTVRGGGLAIVGTIVIALAGLAWWRDAAFLGWLSIPVGLLAGISFLDDLRSVPAAIRLALHFAAAVLALWVLDWPRLEIAVVGMFSWGPPSLLGAVFAVGWLAGFPNAYNFMDGINGHAALQTVMTAGGCACIGACAAHDWAAPPVLLAVVVAGATAGFVPYNFPKARMFMGDVGSVPLGYMLAFVALWQAKLYGWHLLLPLVLLQFNFIFDAGVTLGRRMLKGERWLEPHREHFYERLALASGSHTVVTSSEMGVQLICVGLLAASVLKPSTSGRFLEAAVVFVWLTYFAAVEIYCRRRGLGFRAAKAPPRSFSL